MKRRKNKYDPDNLPLSSITREGLTPASIDQLKAIAVMLSLQDNVYEEMFEKLFEGQKEIKDEISDIKGILKNHEDRISCLEEKVEKLIA